MAKTEKKSGGKIFFIILLVIALAAVAVYFIFFFHPKNTDKDDNKKVIPTEAATEFVITPSDKEDEEIFSKSLIGVWSSYTSDGKAFTYDFKEDGTVHYKKDSEKANDYTYTFKDGLLTIKGDEKNFVYQCSKDAVGMMAKLQQGQWKNLFSKTAEKIDDFNGCVYIMDDFMYMGTVVLCRDDSLSGFADTKSLEGDWIGAAGDTIKFVKDGKYTYVEYAQEFHGTYNADYDKKVLTITLDGKSTDYDEDCWGLDGRVFHIETRYYFKVK